MRSHKPVTLMRGSDKFTADRMDFDNVTRVLNLGGHVHGILQPGGKR